MHFEVNLLQLLRRALLDIRVHLKNTVLLKIGTSVVYLKSQFEIVLRKKEKLAQLVMLERMQTKKNALAASRAGSLALPALVMDMKTGSESISSNEKQYTSFPIQWTYTFNTERSQVLLLHIQKRDTSSNLFSHTISYFFWKNWSWLRKMWLLARSQSQRCFVSSRPKRSGICYLPWLPLPPTLVCQLVHCSQIVPQIPCFYSH